MLFIGLTGSIATGKSTVSTILSSPPYSFPIIDADILAHKVVEPGQPAYKAIVKHFGDTTPDLLLPDPAPSDVPTPDVPALDVSSQEPDKGPEEGGEETRGRPLNRPALGRRVFGSTPSRAADRKVLNGIVHPAVRGEIYKGILKAYLSGSWAVVLDIPLLFESSLDRLCGVVLVVGVRDPEIQMSRLMSRDSHLTREDAENRVKSQGDVVVKTQRCLARGEGRGMVVWNDGTRAELEEGLQKVMGEIERGNPRWWQVLLWVCPPLAVAVAAWRFWENVGINKRWTEKEERAKL